MSSNFLGFIFQSLLSTFYFFQLETALSFSLCLDLYMHMHGLFTHFLFVHSQVPEQGDQHGAD